MYNVSKELALEYVEQTPFGLEMLGVYESLAANGVQVPRARIVGNSMHVIMLDELRITLETGTDMRSVAFSTNGEFTTVAVVDDRLENSEKIAALGFNPKTVFGFETGSFDRSMRRLGGVDLDDAPFNGRVVRPSEQFYVASSPEVQLYRRSLDRIERAFVQRMGSSNKMRFLN